MDGNQNMILGLIWTLILETDIKTELKGMENKNTSQKGNTTNLFLEWVQNQVNRYALRPTNFDTE